MSQGSLVRCWSCPTEFWCYCTAPNALDSRSWGRIDMTWHDLVVTYTLRRKLEKYSVVATVTTECILVICVISPVFDSVVVSILNSVMNLWDTLSRPFNPKCIQSVFNFCLFDHGPQVTEDSVYFILWKPVWHFVSRQNVIDVLKKPLLLGDIANRKDTRNFLVSPIDSNLLESFVEWWYLWKSHVNEILE
jgi:hypothetical protein